VIILVVNYVCKPGRGDEVAAALQRMAPLVAANEPGCLHYHCCRSTDDPDRFLLYEQYQDEAAFAAHREMPHFKEIIEGEVAPALDQRARATYTLVAG
jgi:quinol monooxygenase YgiN